MNDDRSISLNATIDEWKNDFKGYINALNMPRDDYNGIMEYIDELPSAQPNLDEWCRDCKEYDKEKHCCPRWNRVIRQTVEDLKAEQPERKKGKWIERNPQNSPDCRLIECSECGNAYIVGYNINYDDWIDGRNFCMKCGADLRGGSNGKNT